MISCNMGETKIQGIKPQIGAEFCCIVGGMAKAGFTEEELHERIKDAFKPEEELKQEVEAKERELREKMHEALDQLFGKVGM